MVRNILAVVSVDNVALQGNRMVGDIHSLGEKNPTTMKMTTTSAQTRQESYCHICKAALTAQNRPTLTVLESLVPSTYLTYAPNASNSKKTFDCCMNIHCCYD